MNTTPSTLTPKLATADIEPGRPISMTLSQLREKCGLTQGVMAYRMGINQANVSRVESSGDVLLSTLSGYMAAMEGEIEILVRIRHDVYALRIEESRGTKRPRKPRVVKVSTADSAPETKNER